MYVNVYPHGLWPFIDVHPRHPTAGLREFKLLKLYLSRICCPGHKSRDLSSFKDGLLLICTWLTLHDGRLQRGNAALNPFSLSGDIYYTAALLFDSGSFVFSNDLKWSADDNLLYAVLPSIIVSTKRIITYLCQCDCDETRSWSTLGGRTSYIVVSSSRWWSPTVKLLYTFYSPWKLNCNRPWLCLL